jgi:hypothetical protein
MTLLSRVSLLAVKVETTPGVAETTSAADAAYNFMDAEMNGDIPVSTRPIQGSFRKLPGVPGARAAECTFSLELTGNGAAGVPGWATVLLAGCGIVNSTGTLTPRSEGPGANVKTLTMRLYENGRYKSMSGAVGNVQFVITPGQSIMMNFTFRGKWRGVVDDAMPTPTYPTIFPIRASSSDGLFTINSVAQSFATATFDVGNQIELRTSIADETGIAHGIITDRSPTWTIDPESRLVAANPVFGDWVAATTRALSFKANDGADEVTFAAPAVQKITVGNGDRNGLRLDPQTLLCCRDGANAEFSIAFGAAP